MIFEMQKFEYQTLNSINVDFFFMSSSNNTTNYRDYYARYLMIQTVVFVICNIKLQRKKEF